MITTALVALATWWLTSPSSTARRFANAVNKNEYEVAASLFLVDGENSMLTDWVESSRDLNKPNFPLVEAHAVPTKLTPMDLLRGRRAVHLSVTYQMESKSIPGFFPLEADYRGIHLLTNLSASEAGRFSFQ